MRPEHVEFRRPRFVWAYRWLVTAGWLMFVVSVLGALYMYWQLSARKAELHELRFRAASLTATAPVSLPVPPAPYDKSARDVLRLATSRWPAALTTLEAVSVEGVTIQSVEVLPAQGVVLLEAVAPSYAAVNHYVEELNTGLDSPNWVLRSADSEGTGKGPTTAARIVGKIVGGI